MNLGEADWGLLHMSAKEKWVAWVKTELSPEDDGRLVTM